MAMRKEDPPEFFSISHDVIKNCFDKQFNYTLIASRLNI